MGTSLKIVAEGKELVLKNSHGDVVIFPRKDRRKVMAALRGKDYKRLDDIASKLPSKASYAQSGSVVPEEDEFNTIQPAVQDVTSNVKIDPTLAKYAAESRQDIYEQEKATALDPGYIKADTRGRLQRGVDKTTTAFKEAVPESFRNVLPGISDVDDIAYFAESASKGDYLGMGLAGLGALPFIKGKWIKEAVEFSKYNNKIKKHTANYMKESLDPRNLKRAAELEEFNKKATGFSSSKRANQRMSEIYNKDGSVKKAVDFDLLVKDKIGKGGKAYGEYDAGVGYNLGGNYKQGTEKITLKSGLDDAILKRAVTHENKHLKTKALIQKAQANEIADSFYSPGELITSGNFTDDAIEDASYILQPKEFDTFVGTNLKDELVDNNIIKSVHEKVTLGDLLKYGEIGNKQNNTFLRYLPYVKDPKKFVKAMNRTFYTGTGIYMSNKLLNKPNKPSKKK